MSKPTLEKSLALYVDQILPKHISEGFPQLLAFMQSYYDWQEQVGNINNIAHQFEDVFSPEFVDTYYDLIKKEYLVYFPDETFVDKHLFVKAARQLYASKGSEQSIKTFFRVVFNEEIIIRLPVERSLLPFNRDNVQLFIVEPNASPARIAEIKSFIGRWVQSQPLGARGLVETVLQYNIGTNEIFELFVSNIKNGQFQRADIISNQTEYGTPSPSISATLVGVIRDADVLSAGSGYSVGELIDVPSGTISGAVGRVNSVGLSGEILSVVVVSPGLGYTVNQIISNVNGKGGQVRFNVGGQYDASQNISKSSTEGLYRYTIESSIPSRIWSKIFKNAVHPAGIGFNSVVRTDTQVTTDAGVLSLKLYARSEPDGGVNYNNPRYISSREYFEPMIIIYKSSHVYDVWKHRGNTFLDPFDPNRALKNRSQPYQYGNGTFGEFPIHYFNVDTQVRAEDVNSFNERLIAFKPVLVGSRYNYTNGYVKDFSRYTIDEVQNVYGDSKEKQLQFNIHYERSYVENLLRQRYIFSNLVLNSLVIQSDNFVESRIRTTLLGYPGAINSVGLSTLIQEYADKEIQYGMNDIVLENKNNFITMGSRTTNLSRPKNISYTSGNLEEYDEFVVNEVQNIYGDSENGQIEFNYHYERSSTVVSIETT